MAGTERWSWRPFPLDEISSGRTVHTDRHKTLLYKVREEKKPTVDDPPIFNQARCPVNVYLKKDNLLKGIQFNEWV